MNNSEAISYSSGYAAATLAALKTYLDMLEPEEKQAFIEKFNEEIARVRESAIQELDDPEFGLRGLDNASSVILELGE